MACRVLPSPMSSASRTRSRSRRARTPSTWNASSGSGQVRAASAPRYDSRSEGWSAPWRRATRLGGAPPVADVGGTSPARSTVIVSRAPSSVISTTCRSRAASRSSAPPSIAEIRVTVRRGPRIDASASRTTPRPRTIRSHGSDRGRCPWSEARSARAVESADGVHATQRTTRSSVIRSSRSGATGSDPSSPITQVGTAGSVALPSRVGTASRPSTTSTDGVAATAENNARAMLLAAPARAFASTGPSMWFAQNSIGRPAASTTRRAPSTPVPPGDAPIRRKAAKASAEGSRRLRTGTGTGLSPPSRRTPLPRTRPRACRPRRSRRGSPRARG